MPTMPRLLLVEDDAVTAQFLTEALTALPAEVFHAGGARRARTLMQAIGGVDVWLLDANLPDGSGEDLLATLRALHGTTTPAIALTADPTPARRQALLDAGFAEVLTKPLSSTMLHAALRHRLAGPRAGRRIRETPPDDAGPCWLDDEAALRAAGGRRESVDALRALFARELPLDQGRVREAFEAGRREALVEVLHRLKASCGFVGAAALLDAVNALAQAPGDASLLARFDLACRSTLERL